MPYKDDKDAREASKERMRKHRQGVTEQPEGVTKGVTSEGVTSPNYVIPMTRKAAIEITKANYGNPGALIGQVKRKVFSALHNIYDCRYPAIKT